MMSIAIPIWVLRLRSAQTGADMTQHYNNITLRGLKCRSYDVLREVVVLFLFSKLWQGMLIFSEMTSFSRLDFCRN